MSEIKFLQRSFFLKNVPKQYLLGILKKKKLSKENLKEKYRKSFGEDVENPKNAIDRLPRYKLIEFFIINNILTQDKEKELYFEFRDSHNPSFYLYKYKRNPFPEISKIKELIQISFNDAILDKFSKFLLQETENQIDIEGDFRFKGFKIKYASIKEESILEVRFEYLEKIDYLDVNYIPKFVYSLKFGLFWIDIENNLVIIKCQSYRIVESIIEFFEKIFKTYIWKFNLQKSIVDKIFDFNEIVKISLKSRKEVDNSKLDLITIIDKKFSDKLKDPTYAFLLDYERRMGSYFTHIRGFRKKLKINVSEVGKISLIGGSIKLEKCREWLIELLLELMKIQEELLSSKEFRLFLKSSDILRRTEIYKNLNHNASREKFIDLMANIIKLKDNPELDNIDFHFPSEIGYYYRNYLIETVDPRCNDPDCDAPIICPSEECSSMEFSLKKKMGSNEYCLKCENCNLEISNDTELECLENHKQLYKLNDNLSYLFKFEFKVKINSILKRIGTGYQINNDKEIFYIKDQKLHRIVNDDKILYNWDELPCFRDIPKLNVLEEHVKKTQIRNIIALSEKCKKYKNKCRNCEVVNNKKEICISKVFIQLCSGQAHPHSGLEYGDFVIQQKFQDQTELLYGIVKSYKDTPKKTQKKISEIPFGMLTFKYSDHLLEQFIEAALNDTIRFILIVSGRIIDSNLKSSIIEIAKWKRKKIVIIEPKELIPILAHYFKNFV